MRENSEKGLIILSVENVIMNLTSITNLSSNCISKFIGKENTYYTLDYSSMYQSNKYENILYEPKNKETAASVLFSTLRLYKKYGNILVVTALSDIAIAKYDQFMYKIQELINEVRKKRKIGYLSIINPDMHKNKVLHDDIDKNIDNYGIYVFYIKDLLSKYEYLERSMYKEFLEIYEYLDTNVEEKHLEKLYTSLENKSFSKAIACKINDLIVINMSDNDKTVKT